MAQTKSTEVYTPLFPFQAGLPPEMLMLCHDQQKLNLFWLLDPRIDKEGIEAARDNPIALAILQHMDVVTREALCTLPLNFVAYWTTVADRNGDAAMSADCEPGYQERMLLRARLAQERILGYREDGNVIRIDFRRRA